MFEGIKQKVLTWDALADLRKREQNKKIVFCTGCYDILQTGHAVFFSQCKEFGDILVVGVGSDAVISALKGPDRPVNPEINRLYLIAAMQEVDYAVLNSNVMEEGKIDFKPVIEALRPDVFVINDDDSGIASKTALCASLGIHVHMVSRIVPPELEATSTTRIIDKINFSYKAPLRIDFAGGWTDVPFIMQGKTGCVSNLTIKPHVELKAGSFNFGGYPRGSGLSTSTAAELLKMISAKTYNAESKSLFQIAEDLFNFENRELKWTIGRQDQYSIVFAGFNSFYYEQEGVRSPEFNIPKEMVEKFSKHILIIHTGASRNAQKVVEDVYANYQKATGVEALTELAQYGIDFAEALKHGDFLKCAEIMNLNFIAQKKLAPSTSNEYLESIYTFAMANGAKGGKICGAGGGGAFVFYCEDPTILKPLIKRQFVECFEIDFEIEYADIKKLNSI